MGWKQPLSEYCPLIGALQYLSGLINLLKKKTGPQTLTTKCHTTLSYHTTNSLETTIYKPRSVKEIHRGLEIKKATRIQQLPKGRINKGRPMVPCKDSRPLAPQVLPAGLRLVSLQRVLNHIITQGSSQSLQYLLWDSPELRIERPWVLDKQPMLDPGYASEPPKNMSKLLF